jgi:signal transduction histidine kinase
MAAYSSIRQLKRDLIAGAKRSPALFIPICASFVLMVLIFVYLKDSENKRLKADFERQAEYISDAVQKSVNRYVELLRSIERFYAGSVKVDRDEFRTFVRYELSIYKGIRALAWNPRVSYAGRSEHENRARAEGYPDFRIKEWKGDGEVAASRHRSEYFPVYFLEPYEGNETALGFDIASEPTRLKALIEARDSGKPAATGRITLVGEKEGRYGFLVIMPVYARGALDNTLEERRENLRGFVLGAFDIKDMIHEALKNVSSGNVFFSVNDDTASEQNRLLYENIAAEKSAAAAKAGIYYKSTLEIPARLWSLAFYPTPKYFLTHKPIYSRLIFLGGLLFTGLLGAFLLVISGRSAEVEQTVNERTAELLKTNKRLETEIAERKTIQEALTHKTKELGELTAMLENKVKEEVSKSREKDYIMIQQSRLAAMGEMIGNIAHQWRQPLNAVGLIIQNIKDSYEYGELSRESLDESVAKGMDTIMHMSKTIDDFRSFFRPDREKHEFGIKDSIKKTISFVDAAFRTSGISVTIEADEDIIVTGYMNEYSHVLLNILGNARDVLTARKIENPAVVIKAFKEDNKAVVTIADNAGGIPKEIMDKIFDPYFTTKDQGKGTGIGLYMSKIIIEKHMNGKLTVRNAGDGAEFRIEI